MVISSPTTKNEIKKIIIIIISNIGAEKADLSGGYRRGIFLQIVNMYSWSILFFFFFSFPLK